MILNTTQFTNILPRDIDTNFRFTKNLETTQQIYVSVTLNKNNCERHDLKYFNLISYNLTENSIAANIFQNKNSGILFSNRILNNNDKFELLNIKDNNNILHSDISLTSNNAKSMIEKYTVRNTQSNLQSIDLQSINSAFFDFNLYFKVKDSNNNDKYNFMIYCYNSKNEIIEKKIFLNIDVSTIQKESKKLIDMSKIIKVLNNKNTNLFSIPFFQNNPLDLFERKVPINIANILSSHKPDFENIFSSCTIEEITHKRSEIKNINLFDFINSENKNIVFSKKLETNEFPLKYNLHFTLSNGRYFVIKNNKFNIKKDNTFFSLNKKINSDIVDINSSIVQENSGKYLNIDLLINENIQVFDKDKNFYDPYISNIYIDNVDIPLDKFFIESRQSNSQDFKLINLKNKVFKIDINSLKNSIDYSNTSLKLVIANRSNGKTYKSFFEKELKNKNENINTFIKTKSNQDLEFSNLQTLEEYLYTFNISNFAIGKIPITNIDMINNQQNQLIASKYTSSNIDRILSDFDKSMLLNDANINSFYLILKKNIIFENYIEALFEIIDLNEKNIDGYSFSFVDDNLLFPNFVDNLEKYNEEIKQKHIEFEAKILSLPLEYFSKKLNDFKVKKKIKDVLMSNKNEYIPIQSQIDNVYSKLNILKNNGAKSLNQQDVQLLYDLFALNISYAKTKKTTITRRENISKREKKGNINILIADQNLTLMDDNEKVLHFSIDVEKDFIIDEYIYLSILKEMFENNIFLGFFYKEETSNYPKIKIEELYTKENVPVFLSPWISNEKNNLVKEINENYTIEIIKKQKSAHQILIKIDLNKCNDLFHFLIYIQNEKISLQNRLYRNLYQLLDIKSTTKNYTDNFGDNIHLILDVKNRERQYIKYPVLPLS